MLGQGDRRRLGSLFPAGSRPDLVIAACMAPDRDKDFGDSPVAPYDSLERPNVSALVVHLARRHYWIWISAQQHHICIHNDDGSQHRVDLFFSKKKHRVDLIMQARPDRPQKFCGPVLLGWLPGRLLAKRQENLQGVRIPLHETLVFRPEFNLWGNLLNIFCSSRQSALRS